MEKNEKMEFLANSIKQARKIMEKVESGDVQPLQSAQRKALTEDDVDRMLDTDSGYQQMAVNPRMKNNLTKSKMPPEIIQSFMENPIVDPTAPVGMEAMMNEIAQKVGPETRQVRESKQQPTAQIDMKLIEYVIKKTVEETVEHMTKQTQINENFQIKIGDKVFGGKLTALKENKKK